MPTSPATVKPHSNPALRRRRVNALLGLTAVVVGGTAAFTALVFPGFAVAEAAPTSVTLPAAAPRLVRAAQPRIGEQTALVAALPDQAGIWVQSGISGYMGWQIDDAVEAWRITYLDGVKPLPAAPKPAKLATSPAPATSPAEPAEAQLAAIQLTVGQWAAAQGNEANPATVFFKSQTKELTDIVMQGDVTVGGTVTGQYVLVVDRPEGVAASYAPTTDVPAEAQGVMWWRNGTVVIKAVGPIGLLPDFFSIYPL